MKFLISIFFPVILAAFCYAPFLPVLDEADAFIEAEWKPGRIVLIVTISLNILLQEHRTTVVLANSELHNSELKIVFYLPLKKRKSVNWYY